MKPLYLLLATAALAAADPPAQVFQMNCSACHMVDQMVVGPSLVEIAGIYRNDPDGFVKWCVAPQHKRPGVIEMPSMAHLGEPVLRDIHKYIIAEAAGKKEQKKAEGDPFAVPDAQVKRPQVQRIFLPDASPAAIAVALPGDLSFCFDASECRLRYVWKGGFIDGWSYWKGNGSSLAKLGGEVVYKEASYPVITAGSAGNMMKPKFLGYRIGKDGIPTFRYQVAGAGFSETIRPLPSGDGIVREFTSDAGTLLVSSSDGAAIDSSTGETREKSADTGFTVQSEQNKPFALTYRW
ncbi:cytochrome c [Luteolibacter flavescens]|uniref:Cytochrome c n=1 Tax=Luteolibacter flavescens TaxID=1859460 RepID=A0ABT3FP70_9BACT|nr:cytochrome c [Luteolibacter flavescens]MCW1885373.1 cytochrome c [Luteolibacter flavescens]